MRTLSLIGPACSDLRRTYISTHCMPTLIQSLSCDIRSSSISSAYIFRTERRSNSLAQGARGLQSHAEQGMFSQAVISHAQTGCSDFEVSFVTAMFAIHVYKDPRADWYWVQVVVGVEHTLYSYLISLVTPEQFLAPLHRLTYHNPNHSTPSICDSQLSTIMESSTLQPGLDVLQGICLY